MEQIELMFDAGRKGTARVTIEPAEQPVDRERVQRTLRRMREARARGKQR